MTSATETLLKPEKPDIPPRMPQWVSVLCSPACDFLVNSMISALLIAFELD